ncbi:CRISPR-associated endoribonuclease Cas6 [candidate division KSB1 bacterium]|nr:CRISPR-associated endoribonuclease Cas6 [candidate division KSB1 bacterium]
MRIKLVLRPRLQSATIPINYQYPLSAAIYKILQQASPDYAAFLHDHGYRAESGRLMKLFTFSKLWIPDVRRVGETLKGSGRPWRLQVGSPMLNDFAQNFVLGLFESVQVVIAGQGVRADFRVEQVESLPMPEFDRQMRCKCLSPFTASTMRQRDGRPQIYYYWPDDPELSEALRHNLLQKYQIIHGRPPEDAELTFRLNAADKPKSKLITIKQGTPQETRIRCFESYFTLQGSPKLMQTAWQCGLGEHNSQGFGMIEVVRQPA